MNIRVGVAIPYSSNDHRSFRPNVLQVKKFAKTIVAVYTDHFFSGEPENFDLVKKTINENPEVKFVESKYRLIKAPLSEKLCRLLPRTANLRPLFGPQYWACEARWQAYKALLSKKNDYLLFLDADEVIDGEKFRLWLKTGEYQRLNAAIFKCYSYFRSPRYQATHWEECGLMVRNQPFPQKIFFSYNERRNLFAKASFPKKSGILGVDGLPMIHHYAWARGEREMLQKVKTWGHSQERNWEKLVRNEFSHPFSGTDFLRGYRYRKVSPFLIEDNNGQSPNSNPKL